jgi:alpha-beta hydrolase superfamily lysophospholipase
MVGIAWLRDDTEETLAKTLTSRDGTTIAHDRHGHGNSGDSARDANEREIEDLKALFALVEEEAHGGDRP